MIGPNGSFHAVHRKDRRDDVANGDIARGGGQHFGGVGGDQVVKRGSIALGVGQVYGELTIGQGLVPGHVLQVAQAIGRGWRQCVNSSLDPADEGGTIIDRRCADRQPIGLDDVLKQGGHHGLVGKIKHLCGVGSHPVGHGGEGVGHEVAIGPGIGYAREQGGRLVGEDVSLDLCGVDQGAGGISLQSVDNSSALEQVVGFSQAQSAVDAGCRVGLAQAWFGLHQVIDQGAQCADHFRVGGGRERGRVQHAGGRDDAAITNKLSG